MTKVERDIFIEIKEQLAEYKTILSEGIRPDITAIKDHLAKQNGRIGKLETTVAHREEVCNTVQQSKEKAGLNLKWYITTIILAVGVTIGVYSTFSAKGQDEPKMMLLKQVNDSLVVISPITVRGSSNQIDTINTQIFNLKLK